MADVLQALMIAEMRKGVERRCRTQRVYIKGRWPLLPRLPGFSTQSVAGLPYYGVTTLPISSAACFSPVYLPGGMGASTVISMTSGRRRLELLQHGDSSR